MTKVREGQSVLGLEFLLGAIVDVDVCVFEDVLLH